VKKRLNFTKLEYMPSFETAVERGGGKFAKHAYDHLKYINALFVCDIHNFHCKKKYDTFLINLI